MNNPSKAMSEQDFEWIKVDESNRDSIKPGMFIRDSSGDVFLIGDLVIDDSGLYQDGGCGCCATYKIPVEFAAERKRQ